MRRRLTVSPVPVMWRPNTSEWALRGRLGAVAARGLRQEPGARSFSGDGRHQRSRGSRAMIREAFLPKKSHPATLAVVEHAKRWLGCAMHDPLVQPPAFDLTYCTISPLDAKKGPPVHDPEKGPSERAVGSRPLTGRNWDGR
jgi:hypothetical protein